MQVKSCGGEREIQLEDKFLDFDEIKLCSNIRGIPEYAGSNFFFSLESSLSLYFWK